jgi:hypothetical protein
MGRRTTRLPALFNSRQSKSKSLLRWRSQVAGILAPLSGCWEAKIGGVLAKILCASSGGARCQIGENSLLAHAHLCFFVRPTPLPQHAIDRVANLFASLTPFIAPAQQFVVVRMTVANRSHDCGRKGVGV